VPAPEVAPTELLGVWDLARRIVDRSVGGGAPQFGRVVGTLTLAVDGDDVTWCEAGTLTWSGQDLPVRRLLVVRREADGWIVCFDDGRPFHPWSPGTPVVHQCPPDTYRGVVDVAADRSSLRILWDVAGPGKDRHLYTRCARR
jgi:Family of unknown function (DUF6314)